MQLSLLFASVLFTLFALELVFANMTEEELEGKMGKIPKERRLKYMKRETPEEINRKMKERGLVDIDEADGLVPLIIPTDGTAVPNQYIARLRPGCDYEEISRILEGRGYQKRLDFSQKVSYVILKDINDSDLQNLRKRTDLFEEIEQDRKISVSRHHCSGPFPAGSTWNLDRVYPPKKDKFFSTWALGLGIDAYVMDTGINPHHVDFGGRVQVLKGWHASGFPSTADDEGHGTHVASTLGGATYGVAKEVNLIPVKVCDWNGDCTYADIEEGLYWIETQVRQNKRLSVINMSLGGPKCTSLNDAVNAVLDVGIPVAVAAGNHDPLDPNDETDSCNQSPASVEGALTVGATDEDDFLADFSFFGKCVDIYAPGSKIMAANFLIIPGATEKSGTSMAAPLVAGAVAGMLQVFRDAGYFTAPSQDVVDYINHYIIEYAEKDTVKNLPADSNNVMLQTTCLYTVAP